MSETASDYMLTTEADNRTLRVCPHCPGYAARIELSDFDEQGHEVHRSAINLSRGQWDEVVERVEGRRAYDELVQAAAGLASDDGENPEYDRALAELIADTRWGAIRDMAHVDRAAEVLADIRQAIGGSHVQ